MWRDLGIVFQNKTLYAFHTLLYLMSRLPKRAEQTLLWWQCFFLLFCDVAKVAIIIVFRKNGNIQNDCVLIRSEKKNKKPL
jgi:hypothetical protein